MGRFILRSRHVPGCNLSISCVLRFSKNQLGMGNDLTEYRTLTRKNPNRTLKEIKSVMREDDEFSRPMGAVIQG